MLKLMQKEAALEACSTLLANIFHHEGSYGKTDETKADKRVIGDFKDKLRFHDDDVTWDEVLAFSKKWLAKYPEGVKRPK